MSKNKKKKIHLGVSSKICGPHKEKVSGQTHNKTGGGVSVIKHFHSRSTYWGLQEL